MKIAKFFLGLATGLRALAVAAPTPDEVVPSLDTTLPLNKNSDLVDTNVTGYDPSYDYFDYSTAQVWIGRTRKTVGWVIEGELYRTVWGLLNHGCPDNSGDVRYRGFCHAPPGLSFPTKCLVNPPFGHGDCVTTIWDVYGQWHNGEIRNLLIGAVAGTLEALTTNQPIIGRSNCFSLGNRKACNVGDIVRVNLPPIDGKKNFMHIRIDNRHSQYSDFHCCESRPNVDRAIDGLGSQLTTAFPQWWNRKFVRDTRCIIDGWKSC
ncbi:hypothetical protein BKA66DRAFT_430561 [Pyrenochaeta sp. MPI-SDFR-AT-0127]|nr:hypothetical protein BKA66DRAFT_430561 [Pyrenochaeta sp. MPI-SDFR-AT-0127]